MPGVVKSSSTCAVIAPNMAKQIVGLQAMMEYAATNFPNIFKGYSLEIKESHQKGKADTSGTAKAMVKSFNDMGIPFSVEDIHQERDPETQETVWNIPEEYLTGHAWHTYTLISADKTVRFEFTHNVNGRDITDDQVPALIDSDISPQAFRKNWARLIQKIYHVDPLLCPKCLGSMRIIAFIEDEEVIRKILKHLGLWDVKQRPPPRANAPPLNIHIDYTARPGATTFYV